jgi:hypothetical protein
MKDPIRFLLAGGLLLGGASAAPAEDPPAEPTAAEIFEKRIMPIFRSPNPSSCTECHLAGVELKNYILPSHEKTFLSLRDQGLIDLEKPQESKILRLINMGANAGADLIREKVRRQEYEAFAEWIKAGAGDPRLRAAPRLAPAELAQPRRPEEVIRHARTDRVLESFAASVWSQRERCFHCHSAQGGGNAKAVAENGPGVTWLKATPRETLDAIVAGDLIDRAAPEKSLLLAKPTNQVKHGGGQKMLVGDMAYKAFRSWIEDYLKTTGDKYAKASDLPKLGAAPLLFGTRIRLKIANTPAAWGDRMLQVNVHAWDPQKKAWEADPVASSDRGVWGKGKLWAHELWLMAPRDSERARTWQSGRPSLPAGRYLIRAYLDLQGRLARDWKAVLGKAEFAGEAEITTAWPEAETTVEAAQFKR